MDQIIIFILGIVVSMVIFWLGMEYEKDRK
jgi:hypothetical protein